MAVGVVVHWWMITAFSDRTSNGNPNVMSKARNLPIPKALESVSVSVSLSLWVAASVACVTLAHDLIGNRAAPLGEHFLILSVHKVSGSVDFTRIKNHINCELAMLIVEGCGLKSFSINFKCFSIYL